MRAVQSAASHGLRSPCRIRSTGLFPLPMTLSCIDPKTLKSWLHDGGEIALLDVREHGQYGEAHLFYGIPLPFSRLELDAPRLVPRRSVRVVVYDGGDCDVAERAARRLAALGYTGVHVLQGGTRAWKAAGHALFAGVNLPSKTFGELAEEAYHTPRVSADQLAEMLARKEKVVVLDGRPVSEFHKMNIPTATCCPNGELAYRVRRLVPDTTTPIVINCAGRTRSIIGAQTLINLGLPNPVYALENGTQGWYLNDHALEHGGTRRYAADSGNTDLRPAAKALAERFGVPTVSGADRAAMGRRCQPQPVSLRRAHARGIRSRHAARRAAHARRAIDAGRRPVRRRARRAARAVRQRRRARAHHCALAAADGPRGERA